MIDLNLRAYVQKKIFPSAHFFDNKLHADVDTIYYDKLVQLLERAQWLGLIVVALITFILPTSPSNQKISFVLLFGIGLFNFFYFAYIYPRIRKSIYRFFPTIVVFSFVIWFYYHINYPGHAHLTVPFFILLVSIAMTLQPLDIILGLLMSVFFIFLEEIVLQSPLVFDQVVKGITQIIALFIFTGVLDLLTSWTKEKIYESQVSKRDFGEELAKTTILKRFANDLVLDHQKAQVLLDIAVSPLLIIDADMKIVEVNDIFSKLTDFKKDQLNGRQLSFVVTMDEPLSLNKQTFLPEEFEAKIQTRRNKEVKRSGQAYFLLNRNQRLEQIVLAFNQPA